MTAKTLLFSLVLPVSLVSYAFGQVKLERRYAEDTKYKSQVSAQVEQKLTIAGMLTETSSDTDVVSVATAGKRDASGTLRVKESVESLQIRTSAQGNDYSFDSNNPDRKGTSALEFLRDVHQAMLRQSTTYVIDKDNHIQSIELDNNLLNTLPADTQKLVKSQLDPEHLKTVANQENEKLPSQPVNKGDTWTRTDTQNFGAGQEMTFQTEYTYQGTLVKQGRTLDRITSKVLSVMFALKDSPLPLTLKGSDLKPAESSGEILFDRQLGHTVEVATMTRITGDIQFAINNMDLPSKLDLKISATVKEAQKE